MFLDEARIRVVSGKGGDGIVHFRREKFVPRGGPDGGDGGRGGDVVLEVDPRRNTLSSFRRRQHVRAEDGARGGAGNRTGASAEDVILRVPPGTIVRDADSGDLLGDLVEAGQRLTLVRGGRGGRGNARFASASHQVPRIAERGEPGEERHVLLELRLLADVGIVGVPNAGKSTLLSAVTNARPKIADYPFTTLEPNLGVADLDDDLTLVLADIPGLIEGAHGGAGLGTRFLRHIQRTRALIHLIDGLADDPVADYSQVNGELALFDQHLADIPQIVAISKIDLPEVVERLPRIRAGLKQLDVEPLEISAVAGTNLRQLLYMAVGALRQPRKAELEVEVPVYRPEPEPGAFAIEREPDASWRVRGKAIERAAAMTYWEYDEAVMRFQRLLERLGIDQALREAGIEPGDTVRVSDYELEWRD